MTTDLSPREWPFGITDLGITSFSFLDRHLRAGLAELHGRRYGYPECCVAAFVSDLESGRHPAVRRGWVPTERGGRYVPCPSCCEAIGREYIP